MTAADVGRMPKHIKINVTLKVTHRVTVTLNSTSDKSVDELRDLAHEQFRRAGGTKWVQGVNSSNLDVSAGSETVTTDGVNTTPNRSISNEDEW